MRTTKQLSKALTAIQEEAMERIKSFFKGKSYERIMIMPSQHLKINTGTGIGTVTEIRKDGAVLFTKSTNRILEQRVISDPKLCELLPADALLTILDELERMKKGKQLMKP
jgi:hypothetical protein